MTLCFVCVKNVALVVVVDAGVETDLISLAFFTTLAGFCISDFSKVGREGEVGELDRAEFGKRALDECGEGGRKYVPSTCTTLYVLFPIPTLGTVGWLNTPPLLFRSPLFVTVDTGVTGTWSDTESVDSFEARFVVSVFAVRFTSVVSGLGSIKI